MSGPDLTLYFDGKCPFCCAGMAKLDNSAQEWKYVVKGTCLKAGGKLAEPKAAPAMDAAK